MASYTGTALYVIFDSTVLNTDYKSFSESEEGGVVDASAGADANRTYLTTLKDGTASITINVQASDTTTWGGVAPLTGGTLEWAPEGTAAGQPRHYVTAIVLSREKSMEFEDLVVADLEFQFNGAVSDTTY